MSESEGVPDILQKILAVKRDEIAKRSERTSLNQLHGAMALQSPPRGFVNAIKSRIAAGGNAVIAESKRASPSKGVLREPYLPADIATSYEAGGAACLSVLTDQQFFQGHESHLKTARAACQLPVIRKDFIVSPYQIVESRALGADCILLIAAALPGRVLKMLHEFAVKLKLDVLVEVHNREELERALELDIDIVGINNRDLRTFEVSLDTTLGMLERIPEHITVVTESGILEKSDVETMNAHSVHSFLVGEAFMKSEDPGQKLQELFAS